MHMKPNNNSSLNFGFQFKAQYIQIEGVTMIWLKFYEKVKHLIFTIKNMVEANDYYNGS